MSSRTYSRLTWMLKAVMGWDSFQDLWDLGVKRRGQPAGDAALLVERARKSLFIWKRNADGRLLGCGSFELDMPQGCIFSDDSFSRFMTLPPEGEEGDPLTVGDLVVGPVVVSWVALDDQTRPRKAIARNVLVPDWPVFEDQSDAFFAAMLDHVHRTYCMRKGQRTVNVVWEHNGEHARVEQMPLYQGGHWQVYVEWYDNYFWLSDKSDRSATPKKFGTREEAVAAALTTRRPCPT
jgi:hypothetical protein